MDAQMDRWMKFTTWWVSSFWCRVCSRPSSHSTGRRWSRGCEEPQLHPTSLWKGHNVWLQASRGEACSLCDGPFSSIYFCITSFTTASPQGALHGCVVIHHWQRVIQKQGKGKREMKERKARWQHGRGAKKSQIGRKKHLRPKPTGHRERGDKERFIFTHNEQYKSLNLNHHCNFPKICLLQKDIMYNSDTFIF